MLDCWIFIPQSMLLQVSALHWIPGRSRMTADKNLSVCSKAVLRHPGPAASQRVFTSWRQTGSVEAFRYPNTSSFWCFRWTMSFLNILLKMFNSLRLDRKFYLTGSHWWEIHQGLLHADKELTPPFPSASLQPWVLQRTGCFLCSEITSPTTIAYIIRLTLSPTKTYQPTL